MGLSWFSRLINKMFSFFRTLFRKETAKRVISSGGEIAPNVGWILLGDLNTGSSRIHGINIHNFLLKKGITSTIFQTNSSMKHFLTLSLGERNNLLNSGINVLIFQKVYGKEAVSLAKAAKSRGIKTVFLVSDILDKEMDRMVAVVDSLVVTSEFLQKHYCGKYGVMPIAIDDALEIDEGVIKVHERKDSVQLVWVGHEFNWKTLDIVYEALRQIDDPGYSLKTISNHPAADVAWDLKTVHSEILSGDVVIIPTIDNICWNVKSNNRLTMCMALGIPVIASEMPAYEKIIKCGHNGFLARNTEDWVRCLLELKDVVLREKIGAEARRTVIPRYSIDVIGEEWISKLSSMVNS